MADRNIISDEFVQRHIKAKPEIEHRRVIAEARGRRGKDLEKISPYHAVDKDYGLEKIALQTGVASPSQVGLKLQDGTGDKSAPESPPSAPGPNDNIDDSNPGSPGRPKNSQDETPRKQKEFKPKMKAAIELWAQDAQTKISNILNQGILQQFGKKNMRSLTSQEFKQAEQIKFAVLCHLKYLSDVDATAVSAGLNKKLSNGVIQKCNDWIANAALDMDRKLSIDEIRNIRAAFYAEHYQ